VPEAAVAYTESFMVNLAREVGFSRAEIVGKDPSNRQPDLVAQK